VDADLADAPSRNLPTAVRPRVTSPHQGANTHPPPRPPRKPLLAREAPPLRFLARRELGTAERLTVHTVSEITQDRATRTNRGHNPTLCCLRGRDITLLHGDERGYGRQNVMTAKTNKQTCQRCRSTPPATKRGSPDRQIKLHRRHILFHTTHACFDIPSVLREHQCSESLLRCRTG
jgi:hypothetical protein